MKLYWEGTEYSDFRELVENIPADTLASPRRSVIPLVDFVRSSPDNIRRLGDKLGFRSENVAELRFEFPVSVQKGSGRASYTDLAILTADSVIGIEAKYTEPEYESVASWLGRTPSENRKAVLQGWVDLLNRVAVTPIDVAAVSALPYQLIHRAASACFPDRGKLAMAYLVFAKSSPEHYTKHASALQTLMGHHPLSIHVLTCETTALPKCEDLVRRWSARDRALSGEVRAALLHGPLYSFGEISVAYPVGASAFSA